MTLEEKIIAAENTIREAYEKNNGKIFLSFSGGKDSTILRHIALRLFPDLKVVFSNTTNELSEVIKYVKTFPNIITVKPKLSFTEVVAKHGFPLVSKEVSQKVNELKNTNGITTRNTRFQGDHKGNGKTPTKWRFLAEQDFNITHKCCAILKKDPLEKWAKEHGLKPVIALMADESRLRQQLALYGDGKNGKVYPFLRTGWEEKDIWDYAKKFGIRFAECYYDRIVDGKFLKARTRTGCEYCGFGVTLEKEDRFERSKLSSPKRFEKMMQITNNGVTFREAIELVKRDNLPTPELDLYGYAIYDKKNHAYEGEKTVHDFCEFNLDPRHDKPVCECGSKKFKKVLGYSRSFADSPKDGLPRKVWVDIAINECKECGLESATNTPMIKEELDCTYRFIDYIEKRMETHSSEEIMKEAKVTRSLIIKVCKYILSGRDDNTLEYAPPLTFNNVKKHVRTTENKWKTGLFAQA